MVDIGGIKFEKSTVGDFVNDFIEFQMLPEVSIQLKGGGGSSLEKEVDL